MSKTIAVSMAGSTTKSVITYDGERTETKYGGVIAQQSGDSVVINFLDDTIGVFSFDEFTTQNSMPDLASLVEFFISNNFFVKPSGNGGGSEIISDGGIYTVKVEDDAMHINDGTRNRVQSNISNTAMISPDGTTEVIAYNDFAQINGFTKLGADAPAIKQKLITGTTATSLATFALGMNSSKVVSFDILVQCGAPWLPRGYGVDTDTNRYEAYLSSTNLMIDPVGSNTQTRPFKALITYIE